MGAQEIVALMASGGGGAVLLALVNGIIKWLSGASTRERRRNTDLISQRRDAIVERDEALEERDRADDKRREAEEYVSALKRQLIENGIRPLKRKDSE